MLSVVYTLVLCHLTDAGIIKRRSRKAPIPPPPPNAVLDAEMMKEIEKLEIAENAKIECSYPDFKLNMNLNEKENISEEDMEIGNTTHTIIEENEEGELLDDQTINLLEGGGRTLGQISKQSNSTEPDLYRYVVFKDLRLYVWMMLDTVGARHAESGDLPKPLIAGSAIIVSNLLISILYIYIYISYL